MASRVCTSAPTLPQVYSLLCDVLVQEGSKHMAAFCIRSACAAYAGYL